MNANVTKASSTTPRQLTIPPGQEKQLKELFKHRHKNTVEIGKSLLRIIEGLSGGLNEKNTLAVLLYLSPRVGQSAQTLRQYLDIGTGKKLAEVFNMPTRAAALAWCLDKSDQAKLVYDGAPVVVELDKPPVSMRLHEFANDATGTTLAERLINARMCRIRSPKDQRKHMTSTVPPGKRDELVQIWPKGWVRVLARVPLGNLAYLVKRLRAAGLRFDSDPEINARIDADLAKHFPPSQGVSQA